MCFGMRKARPIHLRYENYVLKHFNCHEIGHNVGASVIHNHFYGFREYLQDVGADV